MAVNMNWGLLGYGKFAKKIENSFKNSQTANLRYIASKSFHKKNISVKKSKDKIFYSSYVDLINNKDVKNIYIATTNNLHKDLIIEDIKKSITIFKKELGKNSDFFSYPFGEYSLEFKDIIKSLGFKYAFGQHSGVIDETKDFYELPRFPINEKYGEIKRFNSLTKTLPFKYKKITPDEKYLLQNKNPPKVKIEFYDVKNLKSISCYSNEGNKWRQTSIKFENENMLLINIDEKFVGERGRINCSLRDPSGFWRWLGLQFVISDK